ncbi:MAG: oxidoreductase [SAR202 cluster bacterium]|nr:MAG: oxidoreductase [SAR202 cluster bacterium]
MPSQREKPWRVATVTAVKIASTRVKLFTLELPSGGNFKAGQHYDVQLTAPDGYQAQRSYSLASSPGDTDLIEIAIELIDDGEVSSYFHHSVEPGQRIEIRGPIGGHFTWKPSHTKSSIFIAGGSGIAPIISMLRHRYAVKNNSPAVLLFSVRTEDDILYREELESMSDNDPSLQVVTTITRETSKDWIGNTRRIDRNMIDSTLVNTGVTPESAYVCGGSGFVESMANTLLDIGLDFKQIHIERFGP